MPKNWIWTLAKALEGVGLIIVLIGLLGSVQLGMGEEGLSSMKMESYGLLIGGGLFFVGWLLERRSGTR